MAADTGSFPVSTADAFLRDESQPPLSLSFDPSFFPDRELERWGADDPEELGLLTVWAGRAAD